LLLIRCAGPLSIQTTGGVVGAGLGAGGVGSEMDKVIIFPGRTGSCAGEMTEQLPRCGSRRKCNKVHKLLYMYQAILATLES